MTKILNVNLLTFFASILWGPNLNAAGEVTLADRVRNEMPQALAKIEAAYSKSDGHGSIQLSKTKKTPPVTITAKFSFAVDNAAKCWRSGTTDESQNIYCITPPLSFYIHRADVSAPYTIRQLGQPDQISGSIHAILERHLFSPFSVYSVPLTRIFADPSFKIINVSNEERGGKKLCKNLIPIH